MRRLKALGVLVVVLLVGALLGSAVAQYLNRSPDATADEESAPAIQIDERIRVEVLNAGGRAGMARAATGILREKGVDVVAFHNAPNFSEQPSVVIDRVGRRDFADAVGGVLGIASVTSEPDSTLLLEVTVRIGRDWNPVSSVVPDATEVRRPWWDPRRYIAKRGSGRASGGTAPAT